MWTVVITLRRLDTISSIVVPGFKSKFAADRAGERHCRLVLSSGLGWYGAFSTMKA